MEKGYVYILKDITGRFYIGSTKNLGLRMRQHALGHTQTTRNMDNPKLVFSAEYGTLAEARSVEQRVKKLKRKDYIQKIIADGIIKMK